jgi:hypothetical protein
MSSYYITPIIGSGARTDPFRTKADQYAVSHATIIPTGADGRPLFTWALVVVPDTADQTAMRADAAIDQLPITSLDQTIGSLTQPQRNTFQSLGTKYGVAAVAGLTNASTCRDALVAFGRRLDPSFDPNTFSAV